MELDAATEPKKDCKEKVDAAVKAWLRDEIHGGPLSQVTECWNTLYNALPSLVQRITDAMEKED